MSEQVSVGIDVGSCTHAIAIMSPDGKFCDEFTISHDHASFYEAGQRIMNIAHQLKLPVVAAMEGHNGYAAPFDRYLVDRGIKVLAVNNLRFSRYREMFGQPYKNDPYDARLLADFTFRQPALDERSGVHQAVFPAMELTVLKKLARYQRDLIREATRCKLRLIKLVTGYFPELKQVYKDWSSPNCMAFLATGLTPQQLGQLEVNALAQIGAPGAKRTLGKNKAARLKQKAQSICPNPAAAIDARLTANYAQRLQELDRQIRSLDTELTDILKKLPQGRQLLDIAGCGPKLASRILGETGDIRRFANRDKYSVYCGIVCLDDSSGKRQQCRPVKQINYILKDSFMQLALSGIKNNSLSAAYYHRKRSEGLNHWPAVKRLAHQLCRKIYKLLAADNTSKILNENICVDTSSGCGNVDNFFQCCSERSYPSVVEKSINAPILDKTSQTFPQHGITTTNNPLPKRQSSKPKKERKSAA